MTLARLRWPLVVLLALVIQASLAPDVRVFGVHPDVLMAVAVAAGVAGGGERGALAGFAVGLAADLVLLQTPVGLGALTFCLVGFAAGSVQSAMLRSSRWLGPVTAGVGSAAGEVLFAVLGALVGQAGLVSHNLPRTALLVGLMNIVVGLAAVPVVGWALGVGSSLRGSSGKGGAKLGASGLGGSTLGSTRAYAK